MTSNTETWTARVTFVVTDKTDERTFKVRASFPEGTPMTEIADGLGDLAFDKAAKSFGTDNLDQVDSDETQVS